MFLITLSTLFVCTSSAILLYVWHYRRFYSQYNKIPLIRGHLPVIGVAYRFLNSSSELIFKRIVEMSSTGPSPRRAYAGPACFVVIDNVEQIEKVYSSKHHTHKSYMYKKFIMKSGLLVDNGPAWKAHRRLIEPSFNTAIVKSFFPIFHQKTLICMEQLDLKVGQPVFNISQYWEALALDNILSTSSGMDRDVQRNNDDEYLKNVIISLKIFGAKMFKFGYQLDCIFRWTKLYQLELKHATNGFIKMGDRIIEEKNKTLSKILNTSPIDNSQANKPQIFIDQLFKMNGTFTTDQIRDEVNTIILTGFETIGTTLSLMTLLMAFHPDVQEKLHEELRSVFVSLDEEVTDEHLKKLVYLDLVIKESMRLWPPVPFFARHLQQDVELGGYTIPSGANVCVPVIHIHRDKKYWGEDANEFKPERFTPANFEKVPNYAYLVFSRGPRNCVGYNYAISSLKIVLSHFFRRFKSITTMKQDELDFEFLVVMKVVQGYMVTLERRNFASEKL